MVNQGQGKLATQGATLHWQAFCPDTPIACLIILHDLGEHAGCYNEFAANFSQNDIATYCLDLRGHGQSTGVRGHIDHWALYLADLKAFAEFVLQTEGAVPLYLYGHGLGGLIALDFVSAFGAQINGVVVNSIPLRPLTQARSWLGSVSKFVGKLWPQHQLNLQRYQAGLNAWEDNGQDPLLHQFVSVGFISEFSQALARVGVSALDIKTPAHITHGEQDLVNSSLGARELYELLPSKDKSLKIYPDLGHVIHHYRQRDTYLFEVANWILPRASSITFARERNYKMGSPDQALAADKRSVNSLVN
jgi:alpha-beta hydrolase superfamily lysophospholipase